MNSGSLVAKVLRFLGIIFMALTAGFTVLGGVGTSCAAFAPTNWESMAPLAPFQYLYITYVVVTTAIGILGIRSVVLLVKGASGSYRATLFTLVAGLIVGLIHIITSRSIRGSSMPVDGVVGMTLITLIIFLLFRIPGVWQGVDYSKACRKEGGPAGGAAAFLLSALCFTAPKLMASTHTWGGINYSDAFHTTMTVAGILLALLGFILVAAGFHFRFVPGFHTRSIQQ
jgi:hypothetical protein